MSDAIKSDKQRLIELLESFGLTLSPKTIPDDEEYVGDILNQKEYVVSDRLVCIGSGHGYADTWTEFAFDANGKFESHGTWE